MSENLLTKAEVARRFRCTERTIDRRRADGTIKAVRFGGLVLFRESHIMELLEKLSRKAG